MHLSAVMGLMIEDGHQQIGGGNTVVLAAGVPVADRARKVRVGQRVVVRSAAFDGQEFKGKVTEVAPLVGKPGLPAQGPIKHLDVEVLEVKLELADKSPLMPGMRVDVFFSTEQEVSAVNAEKK